MRYFTYGLAFVGAACLAIDHSFPTVLAAWWLACAILTAIWERP